MGWFNHQPVNHDWFGGHDQVAMHLLYMVARHNRSSWGGDWWPRRLGRMKQRSKYTVGLVGRFIYIYIYKLFHVGRIKQCKHYANLSDFALNYHGASTAERVRHPKLKIPRSWHPRSWAEKWHPQMSRGPQQIPTHSVGFLGALRDPTGLILGTGIQPEILVGPYQLGLWLHFQLVKGPTL